MTICRSCSGEAVKIVDGKSRRRDCDDCVAMTLIKHKHNFFGCMSLESAKKLCSCLANDHKGEKKLELDETFTKFQEDYHKTKEKEERAKQEIVFDFDKKKQEEVLSYQQRKLELETLDENGPEWILPPCVGCKQKVSECICEVTENE